MTEKTKDQVFTLPDSALSDFRFDEKVANVFDDMVSRSVPFYNEMQRMTCEMAADFAESGTNLYDIGCSTGTTLLALDQVVRPGVKLIGLDNSPEMLEKAKLKLANAEHEVELLCKDVNEGSSFENASVVTMLLTLQFMRPLYRERLLQRICQGMNHNGCLILIEKLVVSDSLLNRFFIDYYYEHKRRSGYSEVEITRKREALENVLVPYRVEENLELLKQAGFRSSEVFFRWYNFCGIIAVK